MKRVLAVLVLAAGLLAVPAAASADDGSYHSLKSASNPDWMGGLPDSRSLAALSIPGTHETMSIFGGGLTQTQQDVSDAPGQTDEGKGYGKSGAALAVQLRAGIRMIDIRARVNTGNTFVIHHGTAYQTANFDDVLTTLSGFLAAHPGETVLLRLKQECTGETGSCTDVAGQHSFPDIFDAYAARYPGLFWAPSITRTGAATVPALGDVRGKVVLAIMNGPRGGVLEHYGLAQFGDWKDGSSTSVQDEYNVPDVGAIATKRDQVRRFLDATNAGDPGRIYVNFASGASFWAPPNWVAGGAFGVQGVDPFLLTYMNEGHELHRTGAIMMDFPGGGLINKIISYDQG
jgi:1-phosphatidylinositol phosphodiesterase